MKLLIKESQLLTLTEQVRFIKYDNFINDDGFKNDHSHDPRQYLFNELNSVKEDFHNNLQSKLGQSKWKSVSEIHNGIIGYVVQIMRLRAIIEPHIQIGKNTHPRTKITYLAMKAYWPDDNGNSIRKFTRNIGREDEIINNGKISNEALENAKKHIEQLMWNEYREKYKNISLTEIISEEFDRINYLKWKKRNVTLRGILDNNNSAENGGMAKYGQGLYTAFLGNKDLAKQYGKVYYVVNAIPKHPKIVYSTNDAEIFEQEMVTNFCKMHGVPRSNEFFSKNTTIADEMQRLGYDGLVIKGREMVNYTPPDNVLYFSNERELKNYYDIVINTHFEKNI
jgi:hypothetical protein